MVNYTITLSDAEDRAIHYVANSAQEWIDNVVHERCRIAIDQIVNEQIQASLANNTPIVGTSKDEIVLNSNILSAYERNLAAANTTPQT
jgi:hypothetical protein